jgi:phospholipid-binding lipoprotein MlaA
LVPEPKGTRRAFDDMYKKQMNNLLLILLFFAVLFTGCAHKFVKSLPETSDNAPLTRSRETKPDQGEQTPSGPDVEDSIEDDFFDEEFEVYQVQVADPLSSWNKGMFHFNDKLYFWVLKPLARGYMAISPDYFRRGAKNFFYNLTMPVRLVNCLLQGKGNAAASEFSRFVVNTTAGCLGFGNPADQNPDIVVSTGEDLGQTFGKYGIGNGFYIVWPILGPSTLRDSVGLVGDFFLNPLSYVEYSETWVAVKSFDLVNQTSFHIGEYEALKNSALDPYVALRNSYLQYREKKIKE